MNQLSNEIAEVAIIKGESPKECVLKGIDKLGGISRFINKEDQIFILITLQLPQGFPTNTNLDTIEAIINSCNQVGADKIYVGSFPFNGIALRAISDALRLKEYFESLNAKFLFLDNSNFYFQKAISEKKLKFIKDRYFSKIDVNGKRISIPKLFLSSNKVIVINQVNVDPLFKFRTSLQNLYSIIPNRYQEIGLLLNKGKDFLINDQYRNDLESNILDVFSVRKPDLVINDLFYVLESAGPYIYKDSILKKSGTVVLGNDSIAVDIITSEVMNLNTDENQLISKAIKRYLTVKDKSNIKILGENIADVKFNVEQCVNKLEDIKLQNFTIKVGKICSGCFKQAYHLLNIIKTLMVKDLKYMSPNNNYFLIGENPPEPNYLKKDNIILFGNCAIDVTRKKDSEKSKKKEKKKSIQKKNVNVIKIKGCPPWDIYDSLKKLFDYYNKKNTPELNFLNKINSFLINSKEKKILNQWEWL